MDLKYKIILLCIIYMTSYQIDTNTFRNGNFLYTKKYVNPVSSSSSGGSSLASNGGVISGSVIISGVTNLQNNLVFADASVQSKAVTNEMFETLENITNNTSSISKSGDITIVNGEFQSVGLNVSGNINFPSQSIGADVIDGLPTLYSNYDNYTVSNDANILALQSTANEHDNEIESINGEIGTLSISTANHTTSINNLNTLVSNIQTLDLSQQDEIDSLTSQIANKQNVINSFNLLSSSLIQTGVGELLSDKIIAINGAIETKQNIINDTTNKLPISHIQDLSSQLSTLSSGLSSANTSITSIGSVNTSQQTAIDSHSSLITGLTNDKQDVISVSNLLPSSLIETGVGEVLSTKLTSISSAIETKQNIINDTTNRLPISHIQSLSTELASINTNVSAIGSVNTSQQTAIDNHTSLIIGLTNDKQDLISVNNLLSSSLIETGLEEILSDKLVSIDSLISSKQDIINNTTNKLPISHIQDLSTQLTTINNQISTLTGLQDTDLLTFQSIQDNFDTIEATKHPLISSSARLDASLIGNGSVSNSVFSYLANVDADIQNQINNLQIADNAIHSISYSAGNTTIAENTILTTLTFSGDSSQQTTAFTSTKNTALSTATSNISSLQSSVSNLESGILLKQDIIDANNKLPSASVNYGSSALRFIDITSNLQSQLTGFSNSITSLQNYDTSQIIFNTSITSDVDLLTTFKTSQETYNSANDIDILALNTFKTAQESYNSTNDNDISVLNSFKTTQESYNSSNTSSINTLNTFKTNQETYNSTNNTAITTLNSFKTDQEQSNATFTQTITDIETALETKQSIIDTSNRLPSSNISTSINSTAGVLSTVLQSLTDINTNQSSSINTINDDIIDLQNADSGFNTRITANETNISSLLAHDGILDGQIVDINDALDLKQQIINTSNRLPSSLVSTNVNTVASTLDTVLSGYDTDISNLQSSKQNVIDVNNKLNISNVDISASNIRFADFGSSISTKFTSLDNSISTLTTLQSGDATSFTQINADIDALEIAVAGKQASITSSNYLNANLIGTGEVTNTKFNYLKNVTSDIQAQIDNVSAGGYASISYDAPTTTTTISDKTVLATLEFGDASQQTTAFTSSKNTDLSNTKTKTTNISFANDNTTISGTLTANTIVSTTLDSITTNVSGLQTDVSALQTTTGTHTSSISTINTNITNLQAYDSAQTTLNSGYANDIATLYSNKQDILSGTNKLNPAFIDTNGVSFNNTKMGYLASISSDIQSQFSSKQDTITDGSLTVARTSGLQSALDLKAPLSNANLTGITLVEKIGEDISYSNNYTFASNILTYSYNNNAVVYFNSLTSSTNFQLVLQNVNPNNLTYTSFSISLVIDCATYKGYANTCSVNGSSYTLIAGGGLANINISDLTGNAILQTVNIIFTNSGTVPFKVFTNVVPYY